MECYISDTFNLLGFGLSDPHYISEVVTYQYLRICVMDGTASEMKKQITFLKSDLY